MYLIVKISYVSNARIRIIPKRSNMGRNTRYETYTYLQCRSTCLSDPAKMNPPLDLFFQSLLPVNHLEQKDTMTIGSGTVCV